MVAGNLLRPVDHSYKLTAQGPMLLNLYHPSKLANYHGSILAICSKITH
jgi:hypothetical protein